MGLTEKLAGKTVFVDTAPLIYFMEGHSAFQEILVDFFQKVDSGLILLQTSCISVMEVLVKPLRLNRIDLVEAYEYNLCRSPYLKVINIDVPIAKRAAEIRAGYNLKTPDAIQVATALQNEADIFFTNDHSFKRVSEIQVLTFGDFQ